MEINNKTPKKKTRKEKLKQLHIILPPDKGDEKTFE